MKSLSLARTYLCIMALLCCIGCEKELPIPPLDWETAENTNKNPEGYARRLEMPRLDASNTYNCYTTTYKGKETVTFSIEYDAEKRHSKWVAFTFDNNTAQTNWNRNNWDHTEWEGDPFQPDPLLPSDIRLGDEEHRKDRYDRGHRCASAERLPTNRPSTTQTSAHSWATSTRASGSTWRTRYKTGGAIRPCAIRCM